MFAWRGGRSRVRSSGPVQAQSSYSWPLLAGVSLLVGVVAFWMFRPAPSEPMEQASVTPIPAEQTRPVPEARAQTAWFCLCYEARLEDASLQPTTACRPTALECGDLEAMVRRSQGRYVFGRDSRACRLVSALHPMDVLGGRGAWRPSEKPGSWVLPGQCLIRQQ